MQGGPFIDRQPSESQQSGVQTVAQVLGLRSRSRISLVVNTLLIVWVDQWVPAYPLPSNDHFSPSHRQNTKKKIYIYLYIEEEREEEEDNKIPIRDLREFRGNRDFCLNFA